MAALPAPFTGCDHENSDAIGLAVHWLRETPRAARPIPLIRALQMRFGLSESEAIEAISEAETGGANDAPR